MNENPYSRIMKRLSPFLFSVGLLLCVTLPMQSFSADQESYSFRFKINGLTDSVAYLANYFGAKQYYKDTAEVVDGSFAFEGEGSLPGGIYLVVFGEEKTYFEFIVSDQNLRMETDRIKVVEEMQVEGAEENRLFYDYLRFINKRSTKAAALRTEIKSLDKSEEAKGKKRLAEAKEELNIINREVDQYKTQFMVNNPDMFVTKVFRASKEPEVPDAPEGLDKKAQQRWQWGWFKNHFWDNIDLSDDRMIRTPIYHQKLNYYLTKLVVQDPDSLISGAKVVCSKVDGQPELFKYTVHYITNKYESSKIMCVDKVFAYMAKTYYCTYKATWVDTATADKICERGKVLGNLACRETAPNLILQDTSGNWLNLHKIDAEYTLLYFWDSGCGHCKKKTPVLLEYYDKMKAKGASIEVFAVGTEFENEDWVKFVEENDLHWINASDNPTYPNGFRDIYDIFSTPVLYVLDKDKQIIAKRLDVDQLEEFMENMMQQKKREAEGKQMH